MSERTARRLNLTGIAGLLGAVLVAVTLGGCATGRVAENTPARPGSGIDETSYSVEPKMCWRVQPPAYGAYIGIYRPPMPFVIAEYDAYLATTSPKPPSIIMWYQPWAESGPHEIDQAALASVYQRGAVPMITWEPWDPGTNANAVQNPGTNQNWRLKNILDGRYDGYIRRWASKIKAVKGPVMLRPMHEMNGEWYPWAGTVNDNTPADYIAAWRHIHDMFEAEGATNVTWVWSINGESVPDTRENRYDVYYPGDEYVDWVGLSGFNWGTTGNNSQWETFDEIYTAPLRYARTLNKPIVIAEFASVEQGGDKAEWIYDAYKRIRTEHPEVDAVVYFDSFESGPDGTQDWRIHTSAEASHAYADSLDDPYYLPAPPATMRNWMDGLSSRNWMYLRSLLPVY